MQQLYVDKFASLEERIAFKKSVHTFPFEPMRDPFSQIIHLGHSTVFIGIRATELVLSEHELKFTYKIATDTKDALRPIYQFRSQAIFVGR